MSERTPSAGALSAGITLRSMGSVAGRPRIKTDAETTRFPDASTATASSRMGPSESIFQMRLCSMGVPASGARINWIRDSPMGLSLAQKDTTGRNPFGSTATSFREHSLPIRSRSPRVGVTIFRSGVVVSVESKMVTCAQALDGSSR